MKSITNRQIGLILFVFTISLKFTVMPAIMSKYAGTDIYISIMITLLIEFAFFLLVLYFVSRHPKEDFYTFLKDSIGVVLAKLICALMLVYYLIKALLTIQEIYVYFLEALFDNLQPLFFIFPIFILLTYMMTKKLYVARVQ